MQNNPFPLTIFGDGNQTRDFTFVKDAVQANIQAAESNADGVFNIGSGRNITINELARMILNILGIELEPIHQEPRPGDIRHSLADISKAKAFSYEPRYSLEEGCKFFSMKHSLGKELICIVGLTMLSLPRRVECGKI